MDRIYISGAVTGRPYRETLTKFEIAEQRLRDKGVDVVNPTKNGLGESVAWELHMAVNIVNLIGCTGIYMLKDWEMSKGATLERNIAEVTNKTIIYEQEQEFATIKRGIQDGTGITYLDIIGRCREIKYVFAREIFAKLMSDQGKGGSEIARIMHRDHATVIYYLRKYKEDLQYTPQFIDMNTKTQDAINKINNVLK